MVAGRRDVVSKTVSSDFAHILHNRVHEATQVDAEITLTRRRRFMALCDMLTGSKH